MPVGQDTQRWEQIRKRVDFVEHDESPKRRYCLLWRHSQRLPIGGTLQIEEMGARPRDLTSQSSLAVLPRSQKSRDRAAVQRLANLCGAGRAG